MSLAPTSIDCWIFDLDNTLYHPRHRLFDKVDERMEIYVQKITGCDPKDARTIQKEYFHAHGTTLSGLMKNHDVTATDFLDFVHDISLDALAPDPDLRAALAALPGRRIVYTNADAPYARRVLDRIGIADMFEYVHDIVAAGYTPKPAPAPYRDLCDRLDIEPRRAAMIEDMARNLRPAKEMGMTTIWVDNGSEAGNRDHDPDFVDVHIDDIVPWLQGLSHPYPPPHPHRARKAAS